MRLAKGRVVAMPVALATIALSVLLITAAPARADTLAECQQKLLSGELDLTGYVACVSALNASTTTTAGASSAGRTVSPVGSTTASGSLPTTGSSSGRYVGVGAALIVLGGAALYGATRNRRETEAAIESPAESPTEE